MSIFERLENIDRRLLYLLLAIVISLPLVANVPTPPAVVLPQTQGFFDTIEAQAAAQSAPGAKKKLVIVCTNFSAGTATENQTQAETVVRHLMMKKLPFALFAFNDPQGAELGGQVAEKLSGEFGYKYGENYVNWGFRPAAAIVPLMKAMVRDIPGALKKDNNGSALETLPVMNGIKTADDIGAIIELTGANSLPVWLGYFQRAAASPIPTLYGPTAVMAPEAYPLLKSGQLQGMLVGLRGASEYERLVGTPGFGTRGAGALSFAHFLILFLIALGNVGMFANRAAARKAARVGGDR